MGLLKHLLELADGIMGINLGGGEVSVTQQFFYGVQIGPMVQQVGGKGMPQHVRRFFLQGAHLPDVVLHFPLDKYRVERLHFIRDQQMFLVAALFFFELTVAADEADQVFVQGNDAVFGAFSQYFYPVIVHVRFPDTNQLRQPDAGAVEQLQDELVAHAGKPLFIFNELKEVSRAFFFEEGREFLRCFQGFEQVAGVFTDLLSTDQEFIKCSQAGYFTVNAGVFQAALREGYHP